MKDQDVRLEYDKAMQMLSVAGVPRTRDSQPMPLTDRIYWLIENRPARGREA